MYVFRSFVRTFFIYVFLDFFRVLDFCICRYFVCSSILYFAISFSLSICLSFLPTLFLYFSICLVLSLVRYLFISSLCIYVLSSLFL